MFWAYLLRCADGSYHCGHSDDLERRLAEHASGAFGGYTASRLPVALVWCADFPTRHEALDTEQTIKGWSRAKKEALIRGDWTAMERLARRHRRFVPSESLETTVQSAALPSPQGERRGEVGHPSRPVRPEEGSRPQAENPSRRTQSLAPAIILVRPQLGENIGKAARAMLNFGLTDLRLVAPRDGWPNPSAGPAAAGADLVLERARVFATTAAAVADCAHVYATTVRRRGITKPVLTPEHAARDIVVQPGRSALLFGPERSGLAIADVALARTIVTVPINPQFGSLNLAQAVILLAYELSRHRDLVQPTAQEALPPAPQAELEGLISHLEGLLEARGYFHPQGRAETTRRTLRSVLTRPGWNHLEVRTLRGVLTALERR